jgi:voltage-gated potassium channel
MWRLRAILLLMFIWLVLGALGISYAESISLGDALYFSFITGLTIGYGDIVVKTDVGRMIAILIGFLGVLFTGLIVAGAVESVRRSIHQTHPKARV